MRKYFFQAVTQEGKQISGFVTAFSIEEARNKLKGGGLSILTLEEPKDNIIGKAPELRVFDFKAINQQKRSINGTIEAKDRYTAYKKLVSDYKLEVEYIVDTTLTPSQKEAEKVKGIEKDFEARLKIELKNEEKKDKKNKNKEVSINEIKDAVEANDEERKFMVEKVDSVLAEVIPLLEENAEYIDASKKREIEERINLLLRLKHSNSVSHLKSLTKRLLDEISSDGVFLQDANIPIELQEEINRRRRRFQTIGNEFNHAIGAGLIDLQLKFGKIDIKGFSEVVKEIRFIEQIINVFYLSFVCLLAFNFSFFVLNFVQRYFGLNVEKSAYFLHSPLLWYIFGICFIMSLSFLSFRFCPKGAEELCGWKKKIIVVGVTFLSFVVYTVQFPVIFYWTI